MRDLSCYHESSDTLSESILVGLHRAVAKLLFAIVDKHQYQVQ